MFQNAVAAIWMHVYDLFSQNINTDKRHLVFDLIKSIIQGQFGSLGMLRRHFFNFIKTHNIPEDISHRLKIVVLICM